MKHNKNVEEEKEPEAFQCFCFWLKGKVCRKMKNELDIGLTLETNQQSPVWVSCSVKLSPPPSLLLNVSQFRDWTPRRTQSVFGLRGLCGLRRRRPPPWASQTAKAKHRLRWSGPWRSSSLHHQLGFCFYQDSLRLMRRKQTRLLSS